MSDFKGIPVVTSGSKYRTEQGFTAIKDGIKQRTSEVERPPRMRKPSWIKAKLPSGAAYNAAVSAGVTARRPSC